MAAQTRNGPTLEGDRKELEVATSLKLKVRQLRYLGNCAASHGEATRYQTDCIQFRRDGDKIIVEATDGKCLVQMPFVSFEMDETSFGMIRVPAHAFRRLGDLWPATSMVTMTIDANGVVLTNRETSITVKSIAAEGRFPATIDDIFRPVTQGVRFRIDAELFIRAARLLAINDNESPDGRSIVDVELPTNEPTFSTLRLFETSGDGRGAVCLVKRDGADPIVQVFDRRPKQPEIRS